MNLKESINSADIEIAELAANVLLGKIGRKKVKVLLKGCKYDYDFIGGKIYLKQKVSWQSIINLWNNHKIVNTPLLSMTGFKNNIIADDHFTFNVPYKIEKE